MHYSYMLKCVWFLHIQKSSIACSLKPRGSQPNLIVLHRHLSAMSICLNEPVTWTQLICVLCMNGWQNSSKYKAVSDIPFLTCNAAATICMVPYTFVIPNHHIHWHVANAWWCEHKEDHHSTHCTFLLCRAFHPCTAENGVCRAMHKCVIKKVNTCR